MKDLKMFVTLLLLGFSLQYFGAASNIFAMKANGGQMPVLLVNTETEIRVIIDPRHTALTRESVYPWLCDFIVVPFFYRGHVALDIQSPGDVLLHMGDLTIIMAYLLPFIVLARWMRKLWTKWRVQYSISQAP